jgi:hypothetical protein
LNDEILIYCLDASRLPYLLVRGRAYYAPAVAFWFVPFCCNPTYWLQRGFAMAIVPIANKQNSGQVF